MKKPKAGPEPEIECFYCKGTGHWKRNCPKYLADKKDSKVNKGIFDIHVIDVYLTNARSSAWVFDTGPVAHICNSKYGCYLLSMRWFSLEEERVMQQSSVSISLSF